MDKKVKRIGITLTFVLFLLLITFPPFLMVLFENFPALDQSPAKVLEIVLQPDTKYSSGYTDERFDSIKIGMTEKEVMNILGEPLMRWRPYQYTNFTNRRHFVGLQYSESPTSTHYQLRQIYLDNGIVTEKLNYFYVD